jgi:hypothetical protein
LQSSLLQISVIPGLTRNPVVFLSVTTRDAGSGSGMINPIADNRTPERRARNRRMEMEVVGLN